MHANLPRIAKRWERDYANGGIARVGLANGNFLDKWKQHGTASEHMDLTGVGSHQKKGYNFAQNFPSLVPGGGVTATQWVGPGLSKAYQYAQELGRAALPEGILGGTDISFADAWNKAGVESDANIQGMIGKGFNKDEYDDWMEAEGYYNPAKNIFSTSAQAATPDDITRAMQTQGPDHIRRQKTQGPDQMRRQTSVPTSTALQFSNPDEFTGIHDPSVFDKWGNIQMAEEKLNQYPQKRGNIFKKGWQGIKKGWQGAKDFKTSIGEGITGILDNTMLGKFAAMNDATNPRAFNYNPALQGQIDYLKGRGDYGVMDASGLNKITGGVLAGKNLQSLFGSNDLGKMYDKSIALTQKTIDNFGKQWSRLKKDKPDEYYKKLAFHENKLKQKEREKKLAGIAASKDLKRREDLERIKTAQDNWKPTYNPASSHAEAQATGGDYHSVNESTVGGQTTDWGDMSHMIAGGGLAQRAPRGSYFNGGLASLWRR